MKWSIFIFVGRVIFLGVCDHTHEPLLSIDGKQMVASGCSHGAGPTGGTTSPSRTW